MTLDAPAPTLAAASVSTPAQAAPPAVARLRWAALALAASLVVLGLAWELWLAPIGRGTLALKVLPLALALPGLWRHRLYTYRWLSLAIWLYVGEGLVRGSSDAGLSRPLAWAEVVLAVTLFAVMGAYIRKRLAGGASHGDR